MFFCHRALFLVLFLFGLPEDPGVRFRFTLGVVVRMFEALKVPGSMNSLPGIKTVSCSI
jgi:hypothetical protein